MTTYKGKPVVTWADGFGNWHARVDFPDSGYGNTGELSIDANWDSIRAAARRAIRAEIALRAPTGRQLPPVRIEVEKQHIISATNIWVGCTFMEAS